LGGGKNLLYKFKTKGFALCGSATRKATHLVVYNNLSVIGAGGRGHQGAFLLSFYFLYLV